MVKPFTSLKQALDRKTKYGVDHVRPFCRPIKLQGREVTITSIPSRSDRRENTK